MTARLIRQDALAAGAKHYFTGVACRHGHVGERRTDDGKCVTCINGRAAARRARDPERIREQSKEFRAHHADKVRADKRAYYEANKDRILTAQREIYATDETVRARVAISRALWTSVNIERKREADQRWVVENRDMGALL